MFMSREVWLHWRKQMAARLSKALQRLPVERKREVWRRYWQVSQRKGTNIHFSWE